MIARIIISTLLLLMPLLVNAKMSAFEQGSGFSIDSVRYSILTIYFLGCAGIYAFSRQSTIKEMSNLDFTEQDIRKKLRFLKLRISLIFLVPVLLTKFL